MMAHAADARSRRCLPVRHGRADRTVHVRCDPFGRRRSVSPIDPLTGYVHRRTTIVGGRRHLGLESTHPACRRSLGINATPSDHLPHHRIDRRQYRAIPGSHPTPGTATGHRRNRSSSHGIPAAPYSPHNMLKHNMLSAVGGAKTSRYLGNVGFKPIWRRP